MTADTVALDSRRPWLVATLTGIALGLLAFSADVASGPFSLLIVNLTGKGFVWGVVAIVTGFNASTQRLAVRLAAAALVLATLTYYGLIVAATDRWRVGEVLDGSSVAAHGIRSVGRATGFWLVASVAVGCTLGYAGHVIRRHRAATANVLAGIAAGALASGGAHSLIRWPWAPFDPYWWIGPAVAVVTVVLSVATVTVLLAVRRDRNWQIFLGSSALAGAVCVGLWILVAAVRHSYL